jgi:hypothetical protein
MKMSSFYLRASQWSSFAGQVLVLFIGLAAIAGCRDNPGKWPLEKVSAKIAESLELSDISLSSSEGKLQGTGIRPDGEKVKVIVTQLPESYQIQWDAQGDRGFMEEGYFQLQ